MKKKQIWKRITAAVLAATLAVGGLMVSGSTQASASETETSLGYKVLTIYEGNEYEMAAATAEVVDGYKWETLQVSAGYYDKTQATTCGYAYEHTHSTAANGCMGYDLTCTQTEHTHGSGCYGLVCGKEEHQHNWKCYLKFFTLFCGKKVHTHSSSCYNLTCTKTEHTHSTYGGSCYTQRSCDLIEHKHTDSCYPYVPAQYKYEMVPTSASDSAKQGNGSISVKVHVTCADGAAASNAEVQVTLFNLTSLNWKFWKGTEKTLTAYTNLAGDAELDFSGVYDYVVSVKVTDSQGDTYTVYQDNGNLLQRDYTGNWIKNKKTFNYQIAAHNYVEVGNAVAAVYADAAGNTVEEAEALNGDGTLKDGYFVVSAGYTGDSKCADCGDVVYGSAIATTGAQVTFHYINKDSGKTVTVSRVVALGSTVAEAMSEAGIKDSILKKMHTKYNADFVTDTSNILQLEDADDSYIVVAYGQYAWQDAEGMEYTGTSTIDGSLELYAMYDEDNVKDDIQVSYFRLTGKMPTGTKSDSSNNYEKVLVTTAGASLATVPTNAWDGTSMDQDALAQIEEYLAGDEIAEEQLDRYNITATVNGEEIVLQYYTIYRMVYEQGIDATDGWHADFAVYDCDGDLVNEDMAYVIVVDENGEASTIKTTASEEAQEIAVGDAYDSYEDAEGATVEVTDGTVSLTLGAGSVTVLYADADATITFYGENTENPAVLSAQSITWTGDDQTGRGFAIPEDPAKADLIEESEDEDYTYVTTTSYSFTGWYDADGNQVDPEDITLNHGDHIVLYAGFAASEPVVEATLIGKSAEVTFDAANGAIPATQTLAWDAEHTYSLEIPSATKADLVTDETTTSYTFLGWADAAGELVDLTALAPVDGASYTFTAIYLATTTMNPVEEVESEPVEDKTVDTDVDTDDSDDTDDDSDDTNSDSNENETPADTNAGNNNNDNNNNNNTNNDTNTGDDDAPAPVTQVVAPVDTIIDDTVIPAQPTPEVEPQEEPEEVTAEAEETTEETTEQGDDIEEAKQVVIEEEETPLAAREDRCIIHWIVLFLTILCAGYTIVRAFVRVREDEKADQKEQVGKEA